MSKSNFEVNRENLEVKITRMFNATPERLWQAYTEAEQIPHWWNDVNVETLDVRVGGKWRFTDKAGGPHSFRGEFTEVDKPHKLARTFEYEPMPGHIQVESVVFDPQSDGQTKVTITSKFENLDDLNGMVSYGMEEGAVAGLDRLAKLVEQA